jgi:type IV pilus assembly protein PilN
MQLKINLATQPYEDARRFWWIWGPALGVAVVLTAVLLWAAVSDIVSAGGLNKEIRNYRDKIAETEKKRAAAEAFLNRPENRDTRDRSQFINALIARKAFSWTQVFASLEKIMPHGLQVVSIKPDLNENNQLELNMVVAGESRDRAVELVRRMEDSQQFRSAQVLKEQANDPTTGGGPKVQLEISAMYIPELAREGR